MLQLSKGAKDYERFHLQVGPPVPRVWSFLGMKHVTWSNLFLPDGSPGRFSSWWLMGNAFHWYGGNCKVDSTRTFMYWAGQLDDGQSDPYTPDLSKYVVTTTEKEKLSVRFFVDPGDPVWTNMGGA